MRRSLSIRRSFLNAHLARWLYFSAQAWRGEPVARVWRELEASQHLPLERLREIQWERTKAMARHAYDTVPHYRERWRELSFDPHDLRAEADWDRLPPLERATIQERPDELHSSAAPPGLKSGTSGSSGTPVVIHRSHLSWAHSHANYFRHYGWYKVRPGERYAYFWGLALDEEGRREARKRDRFFNRVRCSPFELSPEAARRFYDDLRREPARFALGYPSAVTQFADEVAALGLDGKALGWKMAFTTSEVLHAHRRERIHAVFGCPVSQHYGSAEAGVTALECEHQGMHVAVESVRVDLMPVGDAYEALVTDLHNFTQPLIRYRIGDLVEPATAPCPCGRTLPLLGVVHGRAGDTLTLPDGRRINGLLPYYIFRMHAKSGKVREYQFVQFPDHRVELRISPGPGWDDALTRQIRDEVTRGLGLPIEIKLVPRFERRGRGKHRDFVLAKDLEES